MKKIIFYLKHNNDIDQIAPYIYKFSKIKNCQIDIFFYGFNFSLRKHKIILYLINKNKNIKIIKLITFFLNFFFWKIYRSRFVPNFFKIFMKKIIYKIIYFEKYHYAFYDWGGSDRINLLFHKRYCKKIICLPHGHDIFFNKHYEGIKFWNDRNIFDLYVVQSEYSQQKCIENGISQNKILVKKSIRFRSSWVQKLKKIYQSDIQEINLQKDHSKLNTLIILPQLQYGYHALELYNSISNLVNKNFLKLFIKINPRKNTKEMKNLINKIDKKNHLICDDSIYTFPLISAVDAVINMGSSIGFDVILLKKEHIYTKYLCKNYTIFDNNSETITPEDDNHLIDFLQKLYKNKSKTNKSF